MTETRLTPQQIQFFKENGYFVVKKLIDPETLEAMVTIAGGEQVDPDW